MKTKKIMGLIIVMMMTLLVSVGCTSDSGDKNNQGKQNDVDVNEEENKGENEDKEDSNSVEDSIGDSKYINYPGTVSEIADSEGDQITVKGDDEESGFENISFNLTDETVVVYDENQEIIETVDIEEGNRIEVIYGKDSPMTKSIPPIVNARALVIRQAESNLGVKVSNFNDDLISEDNTLQIKINEDSSIVDLQGNKLKKEDIIGKEVLVLYGPEETLSIPGQANAIKIILL
ncbi:hypothetical protein [Tissierella creatinophila]|uniref:Uncharacterized protein n=1 Tax=Tissierella creatinophila DSM 6911 TaxID=1123403 RepID=A0A1U7M5X9_TISCR|nr:hypothetical protein [Tissierella creatinophila]OLS02685.1 hypothetical protein TICRE_13300 [Tissierella creatinophila DSM 6911]